jgi:hypothetical protein
MSIPFTHFYMPDGRRKEEAIDRPQEIELMAHRIIKAGFCFEIELLMDYKTVSLECCNPKTERVLSGALCHNGPAEDKRLGVPDSVDKIIREAFAKIPKRFQTMAVEIPKTAPLANNLFEEEPF